MRETQKSENRRKQEQPAKGRHEAEKHEDNVKILAAIDRVADEQHAANYEDTTNEKSKRHREIATIIGIYVAAGVALIAILISHKDSSDQIGALSGQLTVMQGQLDEMRAPSAERPYLFLAHDDSAPGPAVEGNALVPNQSIAILFKNYGKTPAMYRGLQPRCGYWPTNPPKFNFTPDKFASTVLVASGDPIGPLECPLVANLEQIAQAEKGIGFILLAGKIMYDDLSTLQHETVFCLIYKFPIKRFGLLPNDNTCSYYK